MKALKTNSEVELEASTSRIFELELELEKLNELQEKYDELKLENHSLADKLHVSDEINLNNASVINSYKLEASSLQNIINRLQTELVRSQEEFDRSLQLSADRVESVESENSYIKSVLQSKDNEIAEIKEHAELTQHALEKVWF